MKRVPSPVKVLLFTVLIFIISTVHAGVFKWIRVGNYQTKVVDSGDQGESSGEGTFAYYYIHNFTYSMVDHAGFQIGVRDWTDENNKTWDVKISGAGHGSADELHNTIPVEDDEGVTVRRYYRYQPPSILVDGLPTNEPFPQTGDEVNPEVIPGTADIMVESWINTSMGLTIHQRTLAWSQKNHDDYIIFDWTFTNTGNTDADPEIELPDQTLYDMYFMRANNFRSGASRNWNSAYGERPGDSIRISYAYPQRSRGADYDDVGRPNRSTGEMDRYHYIGEATLHADASSTDPTDDPSQPQMTGAQTAELLWAKNEATITSEEDHKLLYETMQLGLEPFDGTPYMTGTYPGTHHTLRLDEQGLKYVRDVDWWTWRACSYSTAGPWTLDFGDSVRIVWATVIGSLSPEKAWEVGSAWANGTAAWTGPSKLPPPYTDYPELAPTANDEAKDNWVFTGKDSLFQNAWNAQWAVQHNYNVPIPPPAPSVEITSLPDRIKVEWGNESEVASDFAGYRVYRAIGHAGPIVDEGRLIGVWEPVFECGEGTANPLSHLYEDADAERGQAYYYYVAAFDNGTDNNAGIKGVPESLESGQFMNRTTRAAHLTRPPKTLADARVVPNPYHVNARDMQFVGEPDKIMFMNLPPTCTIRIYTESGDLVRSIVHDDGSGDEPWGNLPEEHSATQEGQIISSGIYIALIETPDGGNKILKFVVVR